MTAKQKRIHKANRDKNIPCFRCNETGNLRARLAGVWVYVIPEKSKKVATIEKTQDGFAIRLSSGNYLAEQGGTRWEQDTPQGWALFTTREVAEQTLRIYKP